MNADKMENDESTVKQLVKDAERAARSKDVNGLHTIADILQEKSALHEACRVRKWARDVLRKLQPEA